MSKPIVRLLLEKLEQESRRSPFLNCLQGFSSGARFDLTALNKLDPFAARDVLRELFSAEGDSIEIRLTDEQPPEAILDQLTYSVASDELDDLFRKLYAKSNDAFRETGQHNLYVGFPLLSHFDPFDETKSFMAPLMFWPISIVPGKNFDRWIIRKNTGSEVRLNYALRNWLLDNNMRLPEEPDSLALESCSISYAQLEQYLLSIAEIFHVPGEWKNRYFVTDTLGPMPLQFTSLKAFNEDMHRMGFELHLSAVMGIFQANKEGIIQDLKTYLEQDTSLEMAPPPGALFGEYPFSPVNLDPAQWTTHETIGLGQHAVVHGPPGTGKSTVLTGIITTALANNRKVLMVSEKRTALDVIANKLNALGMEQSYVVISDVVDGRREVVTKARAIQDESLQWKTKAPADYTAQREQWKLYSEKYSRYCALLNEEMFNGMRFEALLLHYLQLDASVAQFALSNECANAIENQPGDFAVVRSLMHTPFPLVFAQYIEFYETHQWPASVMSNAETFMHYREERLNQLSQDIHAMRKQELILQELTSMQALHDDYAVEGSFVRWFKRMTSKARRRHHTLFNQLKRLQKDADSILEFSFALDALRTKLAKAIATQQAILQLELSREELNQCAADFRQLIPCAVWNAKPDVVAMLRSPLPAMVWEKSVFRALIDRRRMAMESSFAWEEMKQVIVWMDEQRDEGKRRAQQYYRRGVQHEVKRAESSYGMRRLYNLRGTRGEQRNSLRQIVQGDTSLFLSLFPVTMCTPEVAAVLFRGERSLFDLVIFDEASQVRVEDAFTCLLKGRSVVIAGDRHQMPPSNWFESDTEDRLVPIPSQDLAEKLLHQAFYAESILDYAIQHPLFGDTYLTYHYRSDHADLIAFSNAAFYGNLKPMSMNTTLHPFGYHAVNGEYNNRMNVSEAEAVVSWLLALTPDDTGAYPSVGVVTLNLKQRDTIQKVIARERRLSAEKNDHLMKLEEAGLFIRNLENIQGDERDIIVLSTTFGLQAGGEFKRQFGKLGTRAGYRLFNVLITRAKRSVQVFTSIPQQEVEEYAALLNEKRGNWGSGLIYAYLEFVRLHAAGQGCSAAVLTLLDALSEDPGSAHDDAYDSLRSQLVALLLETSNPQGVFSIGEPLAGISVDAHNFDSAYHLHFGAGRKVEENLVDALHRLTYLEGMGIEVNELYELG